MEIYLFPVFSAVAGGFFLFRNINLLRNEDKLRQYLITSPKSKLWVSKLGLEKTVSLSRRIFLPLGCVAASILLIVGLWSISMIAFYGYLPSLDLTIYRTTRL